MDISQQYRGSFQRSEEQRCPFYNDVKWNCEKRGKFKMCSNGNYERCREYSLIVRRDIKIKLLEVNRQSLCLI